MISFSCNNQKVMPEKFEMSEKVKVKEKEFQHLVSEIGHLAIKHYTDKAKSTEELMNNKIDKALSIENEIQQLNQKVGLE